MFVATDQDYSSAALCLTLFLLTCGNSGSYGEGTVLEGSYSSTAVCKLLCKVSVLLTPTFLLLLSTDRQQSLCV